MALLVEQVGATRVVEVGTFSGCSALCMLQALPPDGRLVCYDINDQSTAIGRSFWERAGVMGRIDLRI